MNKTPHGRSRSKRDEAGRTLRPMYFGPRIPTIPIGDFTKLRLSDAQMEEAWTLCGPTVERNMIKGLPIWQIITIAYLEGLNHGAGIGGCRS